MKCRLVAVLLPALVLSGCAQVRPAALADSYEGKLVPTRTPPPSATAPLPTEPAPAPLETQTDSQGAVTFEVTPLGLALEASLLEFDVVMNTHSVNLGWDLAAQSILRTDGGKEVRGSHWPIGSGHHYSGRLSFPARLDDGAALLHGARTVTLIIRDTDVSERAFTWELVR